MGALLAVAGAGAQLGSAAMGASAANKVARSTAQAMSWERAKQQDLQTQANAINDASRARYDNFGDQQAASAQSLGDYFASANGGAAPTAATMPASSSALVSNENAKQQANTAAYSGQQASALGNLRSFGDVMGTMNREQARDAGQVGQIDNFKQGDASVLPYMLDAAGHAGDSMKSNAALLGGLGQLGVSAGLANFGGGTLSSLFGGGGTTASLAPKLPAIAQQGANAFRMYS
jgi:hypothetical protein